MVNFHDNTHPSNTGGDHIPPQPLWVAIIRVIQAIFAIIVLALAAYAATWFYLPGYGMAYFTFVWTVLFLAYVFVTPRYYPHFYHFWAHIILEISLVIFWLTTFALLADYTRAWSGRSYYGFRTLYWRGGMANATRAAVAFAVFNWILFIVTLFASIFSSRKHHHPSATVDGVHSSSTTHPTTSTTTSSPNGFSAKVSNLFNRHRAGGGATDVEKHGHGGGAPVELNDGVGGGGHGHHGNGVGVGGTNGYGNGVGGGTNGYGNVGGQQYANEQQQPPPPPAGYRPEGGRY